MITELHDVHVSRELAILLKKAGFNWACRGYFDNTGFHDGSVECTNYHSDTCKYLKAPTLEVAQRWLREVKLYNVLVDTGGYKNYEYFIDYHGVKEGPNYPFHEYNHNLICNTYEKALEAGIKKVLEMILMEGE